MSRHDNEDKTQHFSVIVHNVVDWRTESEAEPAVIFFVSVRSLQSVHNVLGLAV